MNKSTDINSSREEVFFGGWRIGGLEETSHLGCPAELAPAIVAEKTKCKLLGTLNTLIPALLVYPLRATQRMNIKSLDEGDQAVLGAASPNGRERYHVKQ